MTIVRAPQSIIGYHGCDREVAQNLLSGKPFLASSNDYDWLGSGIYFWEYAPYRAWEWAQKRYGERAAVVCAEIMIGDCLNLLDTYHFKDLQSLHLKIVTILNAQGIIPPENSRGANRLDRLVIDEFTKLYEMQNGSFDTVRACFPEGSPLYAGSKLLSRTHVQIAVRNISCIGELKLVHFE